MIKYQYITQIDLPTQPEQSEIASFLHEHLDQYGDPLPDIKSAIEYAVGGHPSKGGFVLTARENGSVIGAVVVNKTNMGGYIPENILVYIAIHKKARGKGIGKEIMKKALSYANGGVALHVEPDNPAKILYEKLGFENKYLEMRYEPSK